jgi:hypothetical protein
MAAALQVPNKQTNRRQAACGPIFLQQDPRISLNTFPLQGTGKKQWRITNDVRLADGMKRYGCG